MTISIAWLAGFFDGEGHVSITNQKHKNGKIYKSPRIILSQSGDCGKKILEEIQKDFGGNLYLHLQISQHGATKEAHKLYWNKTEGIIFLENIIPYLKLKQQKAQEVLDHWGK